MSLFVAAAAGDGGSRAGGLEEAWCFCHIWLLLPGKLQARCVLLSIAVRFTAYPGPNPACCVPITQTPAPWQAPAAMQQHKAALSCTLNNFCGITKDH
jgi:hypothetical protein